MPVPLMRSENMERSFRIGQVAARASLAPPNGVSMPGGVCSSTENLWALDCRSKSVILGASAVLPMTMSSTARVSPESSLALQPQVLPITSRLMQPTDPDIPKSSGLSWLKQMKTSAFDAPTFSMACT